MRVEGKKALVTGAGGPMGKAIALRLLGEGASVMLAEKSGNRLAAACAELSATTAGTRVFSHRADVTVEQEALELARAAEQSLGEIDILVNVVGGIRDTTVYRPFEDIHPARWLDTLSMNLMGAVHLGRLLAPRMRANGWGRIVNISSINFAGEVHSADYSAAKAAVASLTRTLAMEFAPQVNVNCVAPGLIRTSAIASMTEEDTRFYAAKSLLKRMGEPVDIANAVLFLACDESSYITGEMLRVSGGVWPSL